MSRLERCVFKLGGSLTAEPDRLRSLLRALADGAHGPGIVVPGGGPLADAVRTLQDRLGFEDALAHRLALDAMGGMADVFCAIEPRLVRTTDRVDPGEAGARGVAVWDPAALRGGHPEIPESWAVTSDSLALWLAARIGAGRCVLVKSIDAGPGADIAALARSGLVDSACPAFAARYAGTIEIWGPTRVTRLDRREAA